MEKRWQCLGREMAVCFWRPDIRDDVGTCKGKQSVGSFRIVQNKNKSPFHTDRASSAFVAFMAVCALGSDPESDTCSSKSRVADAKTLLSVNPARANPM